MKDKPNPGSDEAIKQGCTCPVLDNAHGKGTWGTHNKPDSEKVFAILQGCPLHDKEENERNNITQ